MYNPKIGPPSMPNMPREACKTPPPSSEATNAKAMQIIPNTTAMEKKKKNYFL